MTLRLSGNDTIERWPGYLDPTARSCHSLGLLAQTWLALNLSMVSVQAASDVTYVSGSSQKLEQFIGDLDFESGQPTLSQTASRFGLTNTDLGVSFRHNGQTFVAFGDSNFPGTADALAYTTNTDPEAGLTLTCVNQGSAFIPILIPGIPHGGFDLPIAGISVSGKMYLYYATDADPAIPKMGRTVLSSSTNDGVTFSSPLYTLSSNLFINVSIVEVNCADWPGLPQTNGIGLLFFGTGYYRKSDIYLAFQPETSLENPTTLRFMQGLDSQGNPSWGPVESNSAPIAAVIFTNSSQVVEGAGELSASFNVFLGKWMLFYNLSGQIQFRTSDQPWGPFPTHSVSFDPNADNGYGNFIYKPGLNDTNLCNPNLPGHNTGTFGGVYGPYIFDRFTQGLATPTNIQTTLYHSMSTWNPYNSVLMRAQFSRRVPPAIYSGQRKTNSVTTASSGGADSSVESGSNGGLNFGTNLTLVIKNAGTSPGNTSRKCYLRFPLSLPATERIAGAALTLTIAGSSGTTNPLTYAVYGLRNSSPGLNWDETTIDWNNAPANLTNDSEGLDLSQAIFLGSFITHTNRSIGDQVSFSSWALKNFLNQATNQPVTLIISRLTIDSGVEPFASKESTNTPPTLTYISLPKIPDQAIGRNSVAWPLAFHVDSPVVGPSNLTVTASSSNTNLLPVNNISFMGTGVDRVANISPATNQTGTTLVTLSVSDGIATRDSVSFQLTVVSNSAPLLTAESFSQGAFGFLVSGTAGPPCAIQESTDLLSWVDLYFTNLGLSPLSWSDTNAGRFRTRFYRAFVSP